MRWILAVAAVLFVASEGRAAQPPIPRTELAIHYRLGKAWTSLRIAGRDVEAMVDTGSTGLVVLATAIDAAGVRSKGKVRPFSYADGERFTGYAARAPILFTDPSSDIDIIVISAATCMPSLPRCPAAQSPVAPNATNFANYRINGPGGFQAILGLGLGSHPYPSFIGSGIKRWIVDTPHRKIILNPDDNDLAGFVFHHRVADRLGCGFSSARVPYRGRQEDLRPN
jgi:hypothetical protein